MRVWQRAAILGSLWASVEIIVGSFLHNLNLPFAGSVLAAFGVIVMTAGHRATPERGLIWRAALVCALMKSVSPSAVILGPMVGIVMEGLLLQSSVSLLGGNLAGYAIGGALAVSWSLVQKILSALIAFGPDVVRLYVEAVHVRIEVAGRVPVRTVRSCRDAARGGVLRRGGCGHCRDASGQLCGGPGAGGLTRPASRR